MSAWFVVWVWARVVGAMERVRRPRVRRNRGPDGARRTDRRAQQGRRPELWVVRDDEMAQQ